METDQDRLVERRLRIAAVAQDFRPHDLAMLARLPRPRWPTSATRDSWSTSTSARSGRKTAGLNPAIRPNWMSVAMLCDLTWDLYSTALTTAFQLADNHRTDSTGGLSFPRAESSADGRRRYA